MRNLIIVIPLLIFFGCKTQNAVVFDPPTEAEYELRELDTLVVTAPPYSEIEGETSEATYSLPEYNPSHKRVNDLLHTTLDLKFDWANEHVLGKAILTLEPLFYATNSLRLDAKDFDFHKVRLKDASYDLKYQYNGKEIIIDLGRTYKKRREIHAVH